MYNTSLHYKSGTFWYTHIRCEQGYGVRQSDEEAERWWTKAAEVAAEREEEREEEEEGDEREEEMEGSVVRAQNTLGMFYSRQETMNLGKVRHVLQIYSSTLHHGLSLYGVRLVGNDIL